MAMSDTGSSFTQWANLYDPEPSPEPGAGFASAADGNVDSATIAAAASPTSAGSGGSPTKAGVAASRQPGIEGPRVGKPARRRSRASRRAPVTLLNTDTANFRAMVQQFTGIPAPPAAAFGGPVINFAGNYGFPPPAGVMSFDHHLHHRSQHHQAPAPLHDHLRRQQQQQHQQPQQYTGAAFGNYNSLLHGGGDMFASAEDRLLLQSIQAAQMPPAPVANNSSLGFFA